MRSKDELLTELRRLLNEAFVAREQGANYARLTRAHGYVDGYMRVLLDSGHATKDELLRIVAAERARVSGPSTREVALEGAGDVAAA